MTDQERSQAWGEGRDSKPLGWVEAREPAADARLAVLLESRAPALLDDAELVDALAGYQRLANAFEARVLGLMGELDRRRAAGPHRDCSGGRDITSRAQVVTEVVAATRQPKGRVEDLLHVAHLLRTRLRATDAMLAAGRIGAYQARVVAEQISRLVDESLTAPVEARILAEITADNSGPTAETDLAAATSSQLRRIATRAVAEAEPDQHQARHRRAFADRGVDMRTDGDDGMATLRLRHDSVTVETLYHRLGLIARQAAGAGDPRSLGQRAADLAAAILSGEAEPVTAPTSVLESGDDPVALRHTGRGIQARVNITMTLAALAGYSDAPARLLGGEVIPASVARRIAQQPGSTWYRLLTDPAGHMIELSSRGYRPAAALSRSVEAQHQTCVQVGCQRRADTAEKDHDRPWPNGPTQQANLSPKCAPHHQGKTAGRFRSDKSRDGTITWAFPTGHTYTTTPPTHPVDHWPTDWLEPQSLTHIQQGLAALQREQARDTRDRIADIKRRLCERRLAQWYAVAPPPPGEPYDPDHPEPTTEDYAAASPCCARCSPDPTRRRDIARGRRRSQSTQVVRRHADRARSHRKAAPGTPSPARPGRPPSPISPGRSGGPNALRVCGPNQVRLTLGVKPPRRPSTFSLEPDS